jgi:hypothetical protein
MVEHDAIVEGVRGFFAGGAAWTVFSYGLRTLPTPKEQERFYKWLHDWAQAIAANPDLRSKA